MADLQESQSKQLWNNHREGFVVFGTTILHFFFADKAVHTDWMNWSNENCFNCSVAWKLQPKQELNELRKDVRDKERRRKIQKPFYEMKSSMNLITASDVHFMMMIYDDAPNTYTRLEMEPEFYEWINEYYVQAQPGEMLQK